MTKKSQQSVFFDENAAEKVDKEIDQVGVACMQRVGETPDGCLVAGGIADGERPTIIAVMSYKGGVAKTTTSVNLAVCLANDGNDVLVIDMDARGNTSQYLGVYDPTAQTPCIADVLYSTSCRRQVSSLEEVMRPANPSNRGDDSYNRIWVVPSHSRFADADLRIKSDGAGVGTRLGFAVDDLDRHFDYIIIDCAPALDVTVSNALIALKMGNSASMAVIPVPNDAFAIAAARQTAQYAEMVAKAMRYSEPFPLMILRTMIDENERVCKDGVDQLRCYMPEVECFNAAISSDAIVPESNLVGVPVVTYAPSSGPAVAYRALAKEIEEIVEGR